MASSRVGPEMSAGEVLRRYPETLEVFDQHGVVFCAGCFLTLFDPLADVVGYHAVHDPETLLAELNRVAEGPRAVRPVWAEGSAPAAAGTEGTDGGGAPDGMRVTAAQPGRARAAASLGGQEPARDLATAAGLAVLAAQAADGATAAQAASVRDVRLSGLDVPAGTSALMAEAERLGGFDPAGPRHYRVRLVGAGGRALGSADVTLA